MYRSNIRKTVLSAVFTALIAASSFFTIPVGPVPIVMTTMFVVLSGMLGGLRVGLSAVITYLLLGIIGLPVFAGGTAGIAKLLGPTGGFLIGYLLAALCGGLLYRKTENRILRILLAIGISFFSGALIYVPGLPWLKHSLSMDWAKALNTGLIPFIPAYIIKSSAAAALAFSLKDRFSAFLETEE